MRKCKIFLRMYAHARDWHLKTLGFVRLRAGQLGPLCNATDLTSSRLLSFEWQIAVVGGSPIWPLRPKSRCQQMLSVLLPLIVIQLIELTKF